jgi:ubiquinone/menaquinone biosynthesis C-methylase UbiE
MTLDVGCGANKVQGALGLDIAPLPGVDVVHNLDQYPYPFENETFDRVYCNSILEHVADAMQTMSEIYRILKPGGLVYISLPHYSHAKTYADPTHRHFYSFGVVKYFAGEVYPYYGNCQFKIELAMLGQPNGRGTILKKILNAFPYVTERVFALFRPIESMYFVLRK